jgi:hypothetical protein
MIRLERQSAVNGKPALVLHGRDRETLARLIESCSGLESETGSVAIHRLPGVISVDGCQLVAVRRERDAGVRLDDNRYIWALDSEGWRQVQGLLEPFLARDSSEAFQFLENRGDATILYSTDGKW